MANGEQPIRFPSNISMGPMPSVLDTFLLDLLDPIHEIPEPDKWREKADRNLGIPVPEGTTSVGPFNEEECEAYRVSYVLRMATTSFCEPHTQVIIVERAGAVTQGGGASIFGVGGSATIPNIFYRVTKYTLGIRYYYEFRATIKYKVLKCPGDPLLQLSNKELEGAWKLVSVGYSSICGREVIAEGIDVLDDAKQIADSQAPDGSNIRRSFDTPKLADQE